MWDLCECQAEFDDIAKMTVATVLSCSSITGHQRTIGKKEKSRRRRRYNDLVYMDSV